MEQKGNTGGFDAPPPYGYPPVQGQGYPPVQGQGYPLVQGQGYPPVQGQGNVPPGAYPNYPVQGPPPSEQKVPLYPGLDQPPVMMPPGSYGAHPQQQAVVFVPAAPLQNPPQDHLGYSIFVTICCCWIVGLFAIIKSAECRSAVAAGDRATAELKSRQAKKLAHIGLGLGIATIVITIAIIGIYVGLMVSNAHGHY